MNKIITRIKGGLGNQLFCYAAARRLALINNAELVIDDITGFSRDRLFSRQYSLDDFNVSARKATRRERLEPFERYRRGGKKLVANLKPFFKRRYIAQNCQDFDKRLLTFKIDGTVYLDGLWQSESYFKDVGQTIRGDLKIVPPTDDQNSQIASEILNSQAVALHVRWFDSPNSVTTKRNVSADYYQKAIDLMENKLELPCYFLFSDDPEAARTKLTLPRDRVIFVDHNQGDKHAYADLWLMTLCQHFIIANSTFSWWGAWLGSGKEKIIVCPNIDVNAAWNFVGQIPSGWLKI